MPSRRPAPLLAAILATAACSGPPPPAADRDRVGSMGAPAAATAPAAAAYLGNWTGAEGMVLEVQAKLGGGVSIRNRWDLDNEGNFDGTVTPQGLRWTRRGDTVTAVAGDGAATGLKDLAGKRHCLTVKPGEGYCRD